MAMVCASPHHRPAPVQGDPCTVEQAFVDAVEASDLGVLVVAQRAPVKLRNGRIPTEPACIVKVLCEMGGIHEQLLGHTPDVDTGAAKIALLGHRDPRAKRRRDARRANATGSCANDEEVVVVISHLHAVHFQGEFAESGEVAPGRVRPTAFLLVKFSCRFDSDAAGRRDSVRSRGPDGLPRGRLVPLLGIASHPLRVHFEPIARSILAVGAVYVNGAESLVKTLVDSGVNVCFANPGTSEMHFVAALDDNPDMRCVLGLFEGVVTGAADGYARMAGRPAATLLHLGPGLGNGLANLHNARRARTPMVNVVGDHATYHRHLDAPLTSDVEGVARPMSHWVKVSSYAEEVARDGAEAVRAAMTAPGQISTLILPADTAWNPAPGPQAPLPVPAPLAFQGSAVDAAAAALNSGEPCVVLMNGVALRRENLAQAGRIAAASGARLFSDTFVARVERGAGIVAVERLPYFSEQAEEVLAGTRHLILIGTRPPVTFFAYPGRPSSLVPEGCEVHSLVGPEGDIPGAMQALADALGAPASVEGAPSARPEPMLSGDLNPMVVGASMGALMPEGAIVIDEAATSGFGLAPPTAGAAPHDWIGLTGGSIGQGLPSAVGAAVACPDRKVMCMQADGSGMYTVQALWTMARENLDITTVIFANRQYAILQVEFMRVGAHNPGPKAMSMLDLSRPELDWVQIAKWHGRRGNPGDDAGRVSRSAEQCLVRAWSASDRSRDLRPGKPDQAEAWKRCASVSRVFILARQACSQSSVHASPQASRTDSSNASNRCSYMCGRAPYEVWLSSSNAM